MRFSHCKVYRSKADLVFCTVSTLLAMQMNYIAFSWDNQINANSTIPSFPFFPPPALPFLFTAYFCTLFSFSEIFIFLANNLLITLMILNVILRWQSSRNISIKGLGMNSIFKIMSYKLNLCCLLLNLIFQSVQNKVG